MIMSPSGTNSLWITPCQSKKNHQHGLYTRQSSSSQVTVLDHPPYSQDLTTADYVLFPKVKSHLKGRLFGSFSDMVYAEDNQIVILIYGRPVGEHRLIKVDMDYGSQRDTLENCGTWNSRRCQ